PGQNAGQGAAQDTARSTTQNAAGPRQNGGKAPQPRNKGGKTGGRRQGAPGNQAGTGSRVSGAAVQNGRHPARQDQNAAGRETPAAKTEAGPRKGIFGKLLSIFKRKE
ncbi:MAG: hypothetical protein LBI94_07475, partial [Treponema sp.]|nr:hypothetical protein [Treponema sp.]